MYIILITAIVLACLRIGRAFYYVGCFPRFNKFIRMVGNIRDGITSIFWECPIESVLYVTALVVILTVAIRNTYAI